MQHFVPTKDMRKAKSLHRAYVFCDWANNQKGKTDHSQQIWANLWMQRQQCAQTGLKNNSANGGEKTVHS